jgi:myo-inositol-1(or 4)-monophosphatase
MTGRPPPDAEAARLLELAVEVAREAGAMLRERFERGAERTLATKTTPTDLVSEADLASERAIRKLLAERRPDDGFLGEESGGGEPGASGLRWVVDPLDGTVNFLFAIPHWCVSVAVEDADGALAGVIFDPMRDELFCARRDGAAVLNVPGLDRRTLTGSRCENLSTAMVATGFAYGADVRAEQAQVIERLLPRVRDIRRFGSAALDLAWTAAGRYDAYFERTVKPWDIAAGRLLCERAGLAVHELPVRPGLPWGVLAAAPGLDRALLELVA